MGKPRQAPRRSHLGKPIVWFYRLEPDGRESAFGVELQKIPDQLERFCDGFREAFEYLPDHEVTGQSRPRGQDVVIIGPRLDFPDTPFSSGAVEIAHQIGFAEVTRVEQFHCYSVPSGTSHKKFIETLEFDSRVETIYEKLPLTYQIIRRPPKVRYIDLLGKGRRELNRFNKQYNLGLKDWQLDLVEQIFRAYDKNPTNLALYNISQMWSDHCWHILFMLTEFVIDGVPIEEFLIDILKEPFERLKGTSSDNTEIVLSDNASAITGKRVKVLQPKYPGRPSELIWVDVLLHLLFSAETHNYPNQVASFQGSATEIGGEIRDQLGAGSVSDITHAGCLRVVGSLHFPNGYRIPGEIVRGIDYDYPSDKLTPIEILIEGAKGWVHYANAFGKPLTLFETYSGAIRRPRMRDGKIVFERVESLKPVCYGLGVGNIHDEHKHKANPKKGWVIVRIGGGARPVGFCGGSGSSSTTGTNTAEFDRNAVQRGNPIEERTFYEVLRVCMAMRRRSPIRIIHDQGAGGLGNMSNELIGLAGGHVFLGAVTCDDPSMGDIMIYVAEWQESQGVLIEQDRLDEFLVICLRENCTADIIGYITGDGQLKVFHEANMGEVERKCTEPIFEMLMKDLLTKAGKFTIEDEEPYLVRLPLTIRERGMAAALRNILRRSEVCSTDWFLRCVDQTVGGQVVRGPYCGAFNTPLPDYSIVALSNSTECRAGQATAIGTAPFATCLDVEAGARLSIGRLLTKLMMAGVKDIAMIKVLCNWMWPANIKPPDGEIALLYRATQAVRNVLIALATAIIGGKDSASMATWVKELLIKSIETIVFSSSALVDDYTKHLTADIKQAGRSYLVHIDFARGKRRLGGSSYALAHGQLGDYAPDLDEPELVRRAFPTIKDLIDRGLTVSGLQIGQGGLSTAITKMCIAGGCGATISTQSEHTYQAEYFAEELGLIIECPDSQMPGLYNQLTGSDIPFTTLGPTTKDSSTSFAHNGKIVMVENTQRLRRVWEQTSHQLWRLMVNAEQADLEWRNTVVRQRAICKVTAPPIAIPQLRTRQKPHALVLRARGTNGQQELAEALNSCGFRVHDAHFSDLLAGRESLDKFQLLAGPGGWADMDVYGAAMGMYLRATRNPIVKENFDRFLAREDTLSIGICNMAQFGLRMGIAPLPELKSSHTRPLFTQINLGHFNHQWVTLRVNESPCVFTKNLIGSIMPAVVANGEGRFNCSDEVLQEVLDQQLIVFSYVDHLGHRTTSLPHSPSGAFVAGVCDPTGRHLYEMPHVFDRLSRLSRFSYVPKEMRDFAGDSDLSPYAHMGINALEWCLEHR